MQSTTPSAFNLFGNKDTSSDKKDASTLPATSLFSLKPATTTAATPAASTPPANLFGAKIGSATTAPAAPPVTNLFGGKPTTTATTTAPLGQSALGLPKESEKPKDATTAAAASVAVPPPSALRGKTIEEIVNKWSSELEMHVREFNKFAGEVAVWDRALMENGNDLATLFTHVQAAEREQNDIDQALDHIEQQQKDLSATLDAYERSADELFGESGTLRALDTGPADTERDKNYTLATELHAHLDDLSGSLTQMIDSVNALSLIPNGSQGTVGNDDPMMQISQILSSHLDSLQWIDGAVREVEGKVNEVERRVREAGGVNTVTGSGATKTRGFGMNR
jgi:nuclear pore complex protein Nup62